MVAKNKTAQKKGKVTVAKLKVNKETVKDLTSSQAKKIQGGRPQDSFIHCLSDVCTYTITTTAGKV